MGLFAEMKRTGIWRGYFRHVISLEPILEGMSVRGMPVEPTNFALVEGEFNSLMEVKHREMQRLVPDEIKPHHPKEGYKKMPTTGPFDMRTMGYIFLPQFHRWAKLDEWSPSNKGMLAYIRHRGHMVPHAFKTGKETTAALEIKRLASKTGDPLYKAVMEYRKVQTVLSNHMKNWRPGVDGRVHSTFYFDPSTGQLSSRRPNIQNAPKHDDPEFGAYATIFRSMVKARPGHTIMEFDYKGFHVQTLGFEARDPDIMRIGRIDIHSFVTAHFLKLPEASKLFGWPDDQLSEYLAWVKREHKHTRNAKVKHALLGYNNGMGWKKLYLQHQEFFASQREAKNVMAMLDDLFPKSKRYREEIVMKAHDQGYLISRHGYIRYFWEVLRWAGTKDGQVTWTHGDDHEAALCFYTQNDAHGELKDRILTLGEKRLDERYGLVNTIHDSIVFECPTNLVEEARHTVTTIMEAPSTVLVDPVVAPKGLSVGVDVQAGPSWGEMKELK